jgi:hypothetical protein
MLINKRTQTCGHIHVHVYMYMRYVSVMCMRTCTCAMCRYHGKDSVQPWIASVAVASVASAAAVH